MGGRITQSDFMEEIYDGNNFYNNWAHIGRIELSNNMWAWSKLYNKPNGDDFTLMQVTALAVDPSGTRLAAIGSDLT